MSEWISIEDRVPLPDEQVLVCGASEKASIAEWTETKWGNGFILRDYDHSGYGWKVGVTHWMSLPEAPHE
jgi:hypothetical protein